MDGQGAPASDLRSREGTRVTEGKNTRMGAGSKDGTAGVNGAGGDRQSELHVRRHQTDRLVSRIDMSII